MKYDYFPVDYGLNVSIGVNNSIGVWGFTYKGGVRTLPLAGVILGDNVEISHNCTIIAGKERNTVIGEGTKIDSHVHIAHDCLVGKNCIITAHCMLAGFVELGDNVRLEPSVSIAHRVKVGSGATIGMGSVVLKDVPSGETWWGNPARKIGER